jgi:TolB-like protein/class 3 adenylate cyclase
MENEGEPERSDIAHVLLIDIVGYSKLLVDAQTAALRHLNRVVRNTEAYRAAEADRKLLKLPTGDGMALLFFDSTESPAACAVQITLALKDQPSMQVRMGIHSGPIRQINDVNDRENFAGAGINTAQRVLDCGDAGHILLSKRVAEDLMPWERWHSAFRDLGECEVKHGQRVHLFSLCSGDVGNPALPAKLKQQRRLLGRGQAVWRRWTQGSLVRKTALGTVATATSLLLVAGRLPSSAPSSASARPKTIVFAPFENRSDDQQDAYFAAGLQDEIRETLGKISDLTVVRSRTSQRPDRVERFSYVLDGSIQRHGNQIVIRAWLLDPKTDEQVWSTHYQEDVSNPYGAQRRVGDAFARELKERLSLKGSLPREQAPTTNAAAYTAYLKAKTMIELSVLSARPHEDLLAANNLLLEAVSLDPTFFLAYYQLAHIEDQLYFPVRRTLSVYARLMLRFALSRSHAPMPAKLT